MLYNATKSEKYALRVTVQHRRVQMEDLNENQIITLFAVSKQSKIKDAPFYESIAKCDYSMLGLIDDEYIECLKYLSDIGIIRPIMDDTEYIDEDSFEQPDDKLKIEKQPKTVELETIYYDMDPQKIPRYRLTAWGKFICKMVRPLYGIKWLYKKRQRIIDHTITAYNELSRHFLWIDDLIEDWQK